MFSLENCCHLIGRWVETTVLYLHPFSTNALATDDIKEYVVAAECVFAVEGAYGYRRILNLCPSSLFLAGVSKFAI